MHPSIGRGVSINHKSSNRIEISWLVQVLLNFYQFRVPPWGDSGWVDGGWYGCVGGVPWPHACMCMHTHTCTCMLNMINMDASMSVAICNFYTCICVRVHACACMCMHVVTPPCPQMSPDTPTHLPPPQSHREPKTPKFNNSWTNGDISILFEDSELSWTHIDYSWSPWTPSTHLSHPPIAKETQIKRITITLERIEIIQFCLKICDPWTLLHTYRLGLMCRWGVSYPKWHFYVFDPKKVLLWPSNKKFSYFCTRFH